MAKKARRLGRQLSSVGLLAATAVVSVGFMGCSSEGDEACVPVDQYFTEKIWPAMIKDGCTGCHVQGGAAQDTSLVLAGSAEAGYLETNFNIIKEVASFEQNGESLLLLKPSGKIAHEGGKRFAEGDEDYTKFETFVQKLKEPPECQTNTASYFAGLEMMSAPETLRKAALNLAARLPTQEEKDAVATGGWDALDKIIFDMMDEEPFFLRIKEQYNDSFLTDMYLNGDALDLLGGDGEEESYYNPEWFQAIVEETDNGLVLHDPTALQTYGAANAEELFDKLRSRTIRAVAQEPLELIAYVVRNNKPFTEVLTADYIVVNPYSARAYNVFDQIEWTNPVDPFEWKPAKLGAAYSAGVLTSPMWLTRHPTTDTNRNRHRARMVYYDFLGTDVLKLAERPIDPTLITDFNPTMNNPNCTVCHTVIDPLAGAFMNFQPNDAEDFTWFQDMRPPGFGKEQIPFEQYDYALQWAAQRISQDKRFALAAVYNMYRSITGQEPLLPPPLEEANFEGKFQAYLGQYHVMNEIAVKFEKSGYNLKTAAFEIVKSPYFRAKNAAPNLPPEQLMKLSEVGMGHFLTPEQMHRKLQSVLNFYWLDGGANGYLTSANQYRILYGGIDSEDVTKRIREPNGVMANIVERMANEAACLIVPSEFSMPQDQRRLFGLIDTSFEPRDANNFEVAPAVTAIKEQIRFLHSHLLGEELSIDDPEIERTFRLFEETWSEGKKGIAADDGTYEDNLGPCGGYYNYLTGEVYGEESEQNLWEDRNYTVRAWMAVTAYLLSDYTFIHE